jgi:hypothetical protein
VDFQGVTYRPQVTPRDLDGDRGRRVHSDRPGPVSTAGES